MKVLEKSVLGKAGDQELCEDGLFVNEHFIAVVDGVTAKGRLKWDWQASGCFAKNVLLDEMSRIPFDVSGETAIGRLNLALRNAVEAYGRGELLGVQPWERPQAAIIIYSRYAGQIWSFGDCQCRIGQQVFVHDKKIDTLLSEVRSFCNRCALLEGMSEAELEAEDVGRTYIMPLIKKQMLFANGEGDYAYDILDGFSIHPERVVIHPVKTGEEVVLASDGYPVVAGSLEESERILQQMITQDPLCMKQLKGTKGMVKGNSSFDDRTYVRFFAGEKLSYHD